MTILALAASGAYLFRGSEEAAAWWNDSYQYRRKVVIDNPGSSALTDFQVSFTLDTAALIAAGKMQSACEDIRIVDQDGKQLPHWIEENNPGCDNASTTIWTKTETIQEGGTALYVYYGNAAAASVEDGDSVFVIFNDFSAGLGSGWTATGDGSVTAGVLNIGTGSVYRASPFLASPQGYMFESRTRWLTTAGDYGGLQIADTTNPLGSNSGSNALVYLMAPANSQANYNIIGFASDGNSTGYNIVAGTPTQFTATGSAYDVIGFSLDASDLRYYRNRSVTNTHSGTWSELVYISLGHFTGSGAGTTSIKDMDTDWVLVRKFSTDMPVMSLEAEEQSRGPLAIWSFDEGVNNTCPGGTNDVCDSSGNGIDGAINSATWQTEDKCISGKCLYFNGTSDDVVISETSEFSIDNFTYTAWVRPVNTGLARRILDNRDGADDGTGWFLEANGQVRCLYNAISVTSPAPIPDNAWSHLACTADGTDIKLYVNGQEVASASQSGSISETTAAKIGTRNWSSETQWYKGFLDELKIYAYARSTAQIKADYIVGAAKAGSAATFGVEDTGYLNDGLVGYWPMDESAANTCTGGTNDSCDKSGNGLDGAWNGDATFSTSAKFGRATTYDGTGDYTQVASTSTLEFAGDSFTVSAWVRPQNTSSSIGRFITMDDGSSNREWSLYHDSATNLIQFYSNGSGSGVSDTTVSTGNWYHVVALVDRTRGVKELYLNGVLEDSDAFVDFADTTAQLQFGGFMNGSSQWFNGGLDEVRIYNRAFTPREVGQLYNWAPGPVAHWKLDDNTGTAAVDSSGNGHNGTMVSSPAWLPGKYGGALRFDGTDDAVTTAIGTDVADTFSFGGWFKTSDTHQIDTESTSGVGGIGGQYYAFWPINGGASNAGTGLSVGTNGISVYEHGNSYMPPLAVYDATIGEDWNHVFVVYQDKQPTIYLNGTAVHTGLTSTKTSIFPDFDLGGGTWGFFNGLIDDVQIYHYALDGKQITNVMNGRAVWAAAVGSPVGSAVAHYKFDEGAGRYAFNSGSAGGYQDVFSDLEAYWKMDDNVTGSAQTIIDYSGIGYNGTTAGSAINCTVNGYQSYGCEFGGTNDYITFDATNNFTTATPQTISLWFKLDADGTASLQSQPLVVTRYVRMHVRETTNNVTIRTDDGGGARQVTHTIGNADRDWHHLVGVYEPVDTTGQVLTLYIDGELVGTEEWAAVPNTYSVTPSFGRHSTGYFDGFLDEARIYSRALDLDQVRYLYNLGYTDGVLGNGTCQPGSGSCPAWTNDGVSGKALDFDGTDDYLTVLHSDSLAFGESFAVSGWFRSNNTGNQTQLFRKHSGTPHIYLGLSINAAGYLSFETRDSNEVYLGTSDTSKTVYDNQWHHFAAIRDGVAGEQRLYLNGELLSTTADTRTGNFTTTGSFVLGTWPGPVRHFLGQMDEIKVYDFALGQEEILLDYNLGKSTVLGSTGTESSGAPSNSASRAYCVPGDSSTCDPPVGEWLFEENTGTTARDTSGNGNNGTLINGLSWIPGQNGSALTFDGVEDYVSVASSSTLSFVDGGNDAPFSLSAWVRVTVSGASQYFMLKGGAGGSDDREYLLGVNGTDKIRFILYGTLFANRLDINTVDSIALDQWFHVEATYDGSETVGGMRLYIDGVRADVVDNSAGVYGGQVESGYPLIMGANFEGSAGAWLSGAMDQIRVYDYARTPAQVAWEYNKGAPVAWYKFNECQGTTAYNSAVTGGGESIGLHGTITIGGSGDYTSVGTCSSGTGTEAWNAGTTGKYGASLGLDGSDDYVSVSDTTGSALDVSEAVTLTTWFKTPIGAASQVNFSPIVAKDSNGTAPEYSILFGSGDFLRCSMRNSGGTEIFADTLTSIPVDTWVFVACRYDVDDGMAIYLNGNQESTAAANGSIRTSDDALRFGYRGSTYYADVIVDDTRIYNYPLTDVQIQGIMNQGAVRFE